jgi:hypothetical protein
MLDFLQNKTLLLGPHLRTISPGPGLTRGSPSAFVILKGVVEPWVKPGVWRPEIWALNS